jgi:hypothetical protein
MCKNILFVLMYHRHKLLGLIYRDLNFFSFIFLCFRHYVNLTLEMIGVAVEEVGDVSTTLLLIQNFWLLM